MHWDLSVILQSHDVDMHSDTQWLITDYTKNTRRCLTSAESTLMCREFATEREQLKAKFDSLNAIAAEVFNLKNVLFPPFNFKSRVVQQSHRLEVFTQKL